MKDVSRKKGIDLIDKWMEEHPGFGDKMKRIFELEEELEHLEASLTKYLKESCKDQVVKAYMARIVELHEEKDRIVEEQGKTFNGSLKESAKELTNSLMGVMWEEDDEAVKEEEVEA